MSDIINGIDIEETRLSTIESDVSTIKTASRRIVQRATANVPQTAQAALFTISGGKVIIKSIIGEVTTVMQHLTTNMKLTVNPTVGGDVDICANYAIADKEVGKLLFITGTFANAMDAKYVITQPEYNIICPAGTLDAITDASPSGQIKWTVHYIPLDAGATITAA